MKRSMRTFAWLRDLVIATLVIAGLDLRHTSMRLTALLVLSSAVIFIERALWTWYLLDLRDAPCTVTVHVSESEIESAAVAERSCRREP